MNLIEIINVICICLVPILMVYLIHLFIYYCKFTFPNRKPKLSQYKIYTDGEMFEVKFRGCIQGNIPYKRFKEARNFIERDYKLRLFNWNKKFKKWTSISNERELKKYLKKHPELLEEL